MFLRTKEGRMEKARSQAVLLHCQDPRFKSHVEKLVVANLGLTEEELDVISVPGGGWELARSGVGIELLATGLKIAIQDHGARTVVIVHHQDCGAYGGSGSFRNLDHEREHHDREIRKAVHQLIVRFRHIQDFQGYMAVKNGHVSLDRLF
ncbi:MAG TPA: carbonic anhydrase [Patescibacteria group bacterium]|nr:carbonic anhydrase [Patescibacteria group bacterium]